MLKITAESKKVSLKWVGVNQVSKPYIHGNKKDKKDNTLMYTKMQNIKTSSVSCLEILYNENIVYT